MIEEMVKFRKLLNDNLVPWHDSSAFSIDRTHFEWRGYQWSVINGFGSYGGYSSINPHNQCLLELMSNAVNGGEPVGFLTADDCIALVLGGTDWQEVANEQIY